MASSEPLTSNGGPLRSGQQLFTKLSCSLIFFTCSPVAASHARTDLSGDALSTRSPSVVHCTSRTAFLCPAKRSAAAQGHAGLHACELMLSIRTHTTWSCPRAVSVHAGHPPPIHLHDAIMQLCTILLPNTGKWFYVAQVRAMKCSIDCLDGIISL